MSHVFSRNADFVKTLTEWSRQARKIGRLSPDVACNKYARIHGIAVIMYADDSAAIYTNETGKGPVKVERVKDVTWI